MLSRRIPLLPNQAPVRPPQQPASALPLHLQRSATVTGHSSQPPSRPSTPPGGPTPYRSSSPFRNRPMSVPPRPQSPGMSTALGNPIASFSRTRWWWIRSTWTSSCAPSHAARFKRQIVCVACTLGVTASAREGQQRTLGLAAQDVQPSTARTTPETVPPASMTATSTTAATNLALHRQWPWPWHPPPLRHSVVDAPRWSAGWIAARDPAR